MSLRGAASPLVAGGAAAFAVAVDLTRWIRFPLLSDPEPSWALARLLLGIGVVAAAASTAGIVAAAFFLWGRSRTCRAPFEPLLFSRGACIGLAAGAFLAGALLRVVWLERIPEPLFQDDVALIAPSLELEGSWRDFANSIRPIPYGVAKPHGMIGVLYLELYRFSLLVFGTSVAGVRSLSVLAGLLSLITALLLARELFPRGGGALALLALAGMRWHLILSRWGWHAIVIAPIIDLATLLLLRSRRRESAFLAAGSGFLLGVGAHVYLASWVSAVALLALAVWPAESGLSGSLRFRIALLFLAGFLVSSAPLFLFREGRIVPYFVRTGAHNVLLEMRYTRSVLPLAAAAADSICAAWFVGDPEPRHDLAGRSRLGWILGIPAAAAFARALRFPRQEFSVFLLAHSGAAFAASVVSGEGGHPNSVRFGYLSTAAAVVSAGGILLLLRAVPARYRRAAALAAVGLLAINGALAARDVFARWAERPETFSSFHGEDTLLGRAAVRWGHYGAVTIAPRLGHEPTTTQAVWRFSLDPDDPRPGKELPAASGRTRRRFRIVAADTPAETEERLVERVRDPSGRDWAVVLARQRH